MGRFGNPQHSLSLSEGSGNQTKAQQLQIQNFSMQVSTPTFFWGGGGGVVVCLSCKGPGVHVQGNIMVICSTCNSNLME